MSICKRIYRGFISLVLLGLIGACGQKANNRTSGDVDAETDSIAMCVAHGIPSRAAAIAESKTGHDFLGADNAPMVYIKGGTFRMGSAQFADASPVHEVTVDGFWMDEHEVTNAQFARFVRPQAIKPLLNGR